jgi:5-methylcytosine-specific restriction endonuclease McrA
MAFRCKNTRNLEIHHIKDDGGNNLNNAQVLCQACHTNIHAYGKLDHSPQSFQQDVKEAALKKAGNRCQCISDNCH